MRTGVQRINACFGSRRLSSFNLQREERVGQVHNGRTLVAKKRLIMDFTYGGLKVFFSKEIAVRLVLNILQRLNMQQDAPKGQKHFYKNSWTGH